VIRDPSALRVHVVPVLAVTRRGDPFQVAQQTCLEVGFGKPVDPPHDHRCPAHHAVRDPTVVVLVVPVGHVLRGAQEARVVS
jgi:hypothetical protein